MTASRWTTGELGGTPDRAHYYRASSDRELVIAMRELDVAAVEEFIERFQHVASIQAARLRIPEAERRGWVVELLYAVSVTLCRHGRIGIPRSLTSYVITSCKRKVFADVRDRALRKVREGEAAVDAAGLGERAVIACSSEYSLRAMYAADHEVSALPSVLERLASAFDEGITDEERELLSWVAQRIPYSTIAGWLGAQRSAVIKRVTRLRARLIDAALRFGGVLDRGERDELLRFLRRTGVYTEHDLAMLELRARNAVSKADNGKSDHKGPGHA